MRARRLLKCEPLEPRNMLSGGTPDVSFSGLDSQATTSDAPAPLVAELNVSARQLLASTGLPDSPWSWLAGTQWYVPAENLLAYSTPSDLSAPTAIGDQTLWNITSSTGIVIEGEFIVQLSDLPIPESNTFSGIVTRNGQIRIMFDTNSEALGVGQMRYVQGAWRMEMQMATGSSELITHWAYMSQAQSDTTPPEPGEFSPDEDLVSSEWLWVEGTRWGIVDATLFGTEKAGVFEVTNYRNGYFWGSGSSLQPFNVLGSITPEGNVLLLVSVDGAAPQSRMGQIRETSTGARMTLRTYEGVPAVGRAWTLADSTSSTSSAPQDGTRGLLASRGV